MSEKWWEINPDFDNEAKLSKLSKQSYPVLFRRFRDEKPKDGEVILLASFDRETASGMCIGGTYYEDDLEDDLDDDRYCVLHARKEESPFRHLDGMKFEYWSEMPFPWIGVLDACRERKAAP